VQLGQEIFLASRLLAVQHLSSLEKLKKDPGPHKLLNTERPDRTWRELCALDPETGDVGCESASLKWLRVSYSESAGGSSVVFEN